VVFVHENEADPRQVLSDNKVIAVVGASKNPEKDAYTVPEFMQKKGYEIIPVNPTADTIHGAMCYPSLEAIPDDVARRIQVVDVFRPSEELPEVARSVAKLKARTGRPLIFWAQLGLKNEEAKKILAEAGIGYVMDRCMRVEQRTLTGVF
jgi:hypothetical protein